MGLDEFEVAGGAVRGRTISNDPAFSCGVRMRAANVKVIEIAMRITGAQEGDHAQLFWESTLQPTSEETSVGLRLE